jgi:hypothetical protein
MFGLKTVITMETHKKEFIRKYNFHELIKEKG